MTLSVHFHYHHNRPRSHVLRRPAVSCVKATLPSIDQASRNRRAIALDHPHGQLGRSVGRSGQPGRPSSGPVARRGRLAPRHARSNGRSDPGPISDYRPDVSLINFPTKIPSPAGRCPAASIMRRPAATPYSRPHIFPIHIGCLVAARFLHYIKPISHGLYVAPVTAAPPICRPSVIS